MAVGVLRRPPTEVYVDIATPSAWDGTTVTCVDLDLDVARQVDGQVLVADEDEFAEHRESLGYPDDVVRRATDALRWAREALASAGAPFRRLAPRWFAALDEVVPA